MSELERALAFMDGLDDRAASRVEEYRWGVALFHDDLPNVHDLNYVRVTEPGAGAQEIVDEADRLQEELDHRFVRTDLDGELLASGFADEGYEVQRHVVMLLRGDPDRASEARVEEVDDELLRDAWAETIRLYPWGEDEEVVRQLVAARSVYAAANDVRRFAVLDDGAPVAWCELYAGEGIGQVEDVATLPAYRGRGYARAVVLHAVAESRAAGHDLTFLVADADDWPQQLYRKLGFEPAGARWRFLRT
jgi:ribosomal protein S18 acetylase RimI-like enzyme